MATVSVEILKSGLQVSQNNEELVIPLEPNTNKTESVKIWSSRCRAQIYEDEINEWFSDVLETNCRLVLMPAEINLKVSYFYAIHKDDVVSFADAYSFSFNWRKFFN